MKHLLTLLTFLFSLSNLNAYPRPNWKRVDYKIGKCQYNTRYHILIKEGTDLKFNGCKLISGNWNSFYTNKLLKKPSETQIDHVFPSSLMYKCGLRDKKLREAFNDKENLVISSAKENRDKSDKLIVPFAISECKKQEVKNIQESIIKKYNLESCKFIK